MWRGLILVFVVLLAHRPAIADSQISGWTVSDKRSEKGSCRAYHQYQDAKNGNLNTRVTLLMGGDTGPDAMLLIFSDEAMKFDKPFDFPAGLSSDGAVLVPEGQWHAYGTVVYRRFDDIEAMRARFSRLTTLTLTTKDSKVTYEARYLDAAIIATQLCLQP